MRAILRSLIGGLQEREVPDPPPQHLQLPYHIPRGYATIVYDLVGVAGPSIISDAEFAVYQERPRNT